MQFLRLVQFLSLAKFVLGAGFIAQGAVEPAELVVSVWLLRRERDGAQQSGLRLIVVLLLQVDCSEIDLNDPLVVVDLCGSFEKGKRSLRMVVLPFNVAQISQSLSISGVKRYLGLKLLSGPVVLLALPVEIPQSEVHIRLAWRGFCRSFEFSDRLFCLTQPV